MPMQTTGPSNKTRFYGRILDPKAPVRLENNAGESFSWAYSLKNQMLGWA